MPEDVSLTEILTSLERPSTVRFVAETPSGIFTMSSTGRIARWSNDEWTVLHNFDTTHSSRGALVEDERGRIWAGVPGSLQIAVHTPGDGDVVSFEPVPFLTGLTAMAVSARMGILAAGGRGPSS